MIFPSIRKSVFFAVAISCVLPVSAAFAQSGAALTDPVLENTPLPDYQYTPGGEDTP